MMQRHEKHILIIGAGKAGQLLAKDIRKSYRSYHVVGFVDDGTPRKGVTVLGSISECSAIVNRYPIDEIIIAIPSADGTLIRTILLANLTHRLPIRIVPRSQQVIGTSDVSYGGVKDVHPEDFLGRPFIRTHVDQLKQFYKNKTVFVTGGAGSIGSEIVRQLLDLDVKKVVVYDNSEYLIFMLEQQLRELGMRDRCQLVIGSILNGEKLGHLFERIKPDVLFHAAAYKHVHLMQDNIDESVSNNVLGTQTVIDTAIKQHIPHVTFISTDKVVNPTSVMGATKKLCEYYLNSLTPARTKFQIVRFGNVINSNGSVLPLFERQIAMHRYVTVTHRKMKRFFMSIREAAQLVIESGTAGSDTSVHLLNMGELINVYEVALCLIRSQNLLPDQDVEVRVTGLRKGEKLIEELYTDAEAKHVKTTDDERIFSLTATAPCPFDINKAIAELADGVRKDGDHRALRKTLKRLFPSLKF